MKFKKCFNLALCSCAIFVASLYKADAQWQTQSISIAPGWSAIYVHVDPAYDTLEGLVGSDSGNPIAELWMWNPSGITAQYLTSPETPLVGSQWARWERITTGQIGTLARLVPNAAYLVHSTSSNNYTWNIKGKPMAPNYSWSTTGENLLGFPTVPTGP